MEHGLIVIKKNAPEMIFVGESNTDVINQAAQMMFGHPGDRFLIEDMKRSMLIDGYFTYRDVDLHLCEVSPKSVGFWVEGVTPQSDIIKWGKDGDTVRPYANRKQAEDQVKYLKESKDQYDRLYIVEMFSNGQCKHYEVD